MLASIQFSILSENLKIEMYITITLHVVLYERETFSLTLIKEELRLKVFRPKREEVGGSWRRLHKENLQTRVYPNFPDWPPGARTANGTALCH
jgi:hypothetical protein